MDMAMTSSMAMTGAMSPPSPTTASGIAMTMSSSAASTGASMGGGMSMGGGGCRISMLWNWYTIDACFIARTWRVRSAGAFAASCIGIILLVISLEFLRRTQREFDRYIRRSQATNTVQHSENASSDGASKTNGHVRVSGLEHHEGRAAPKLKLWQQLIRSVLYMLQFAVGYFVMLLAMYYNGYIIICIFLGALLGAFIFQWDTLHVPTQIEQRDACC